MNDIKPMIFLFTALFVMMIGMLLTANALAKRVSDGWLVLAAVILALLTGTTFLAAYMRNINETAERREKHKQEMESIRQGKSAERNR